MQSADCRRINCIGARDVGLCLTSSKASEGLLPLMMGQLAGTAKFHPSRLSALATLAGVGADQFTLELCEPAEDRQHEASVRRGGISPCIFQRAKPGPTLGNVIQHVEKITSRSRKPVKTRNNYDVAPPKAAK